MKTLIKGAYYAIKKGILKAKHYKKHKDAKKGKISSETSHSDCSGDCSESKKKEKEMTVPRTKNQMILLRSAMIAVVGIDKTEEIIIEYVRTKDNLKEIMEEK